MTVASRAVIWDLDGTLIDSAPDLTAAVNTLLLDHGSHKLIEATVRPMIGDGAAQLVARAFAAAGVTIGAERRHASVQRFLQLYGEDPVRETRLFRGALAVIDELTRAGCVHGVCTNKPHAITRIILGRLGLTGKIASVVGGDSTPQQKPHAAPLLRCLEQLGVAGVPAIMIGDTYLDVLAARAAGIPVIIVSFGYSRHPAQDLGADAVVDHLDQIPDAIAGISADSTAPVRTRQLVAPGGHA